MPVSQSQLDQVITAIHAAPHQLVMNFAGAGSLALAWLHRVGGSSRTILEATDRYAARSLIEAIGFVPERFTAAQVARALAGQAFRRACRLAEPRTPVMGIGCTATIATDRLKRGGHRCCIAVSDAQGVTTYSLALTKGRRTRYEEEELVSLLLLRAVAQGCEVTGAPELDLIEGEALIQAYKPDDLVSRLIAGELDWVFVAPDGRLSTAETYPNLALLSGAFNPLHAGHRELAHVAAKILQQDVFFELPVVNADKGTIEPAEARRRLAQFAGLAPVILTRSPLFSQKAQFFPHSVFVLGIDTVQRLIEPRFYNDNPAEMLASFEAVRAAGCRFLVGGRLMGDRFLTLAEVDLPAGYRFIFEDIPEKDFRIDLSSTTLRNEQG
ncbi:MAG: hypothetical protein AB1801_27955 [Chloroflexota bacterium]